MTNILPKPVYKTSHPIVRWVLAPIITLCLLTACGGGGGGSNANDSTPTPPPTQNSQWDSINWDSGQWQ